MEAIKSALHSALHSTYGEFALSMGKQDRDFSICIHKYIDYVIYIRPDDRQTQYACHYARRDDLERTADEKPEVQEWRQQAVFQLPRVYQGGLGKYAEIVLHYVASATERMELYKEVSGRGTYTRVRTFAEALLDRQQNPKPKRPAVILPPPVCRRHNDVHKEAGKRKRKQEAIAAEVEARVQREGSYIWRP